tara:strand:- start:1864 stop:2226 length:363 start_codon:yes stop_codon:yes gene_type:complete
MMEGIFRSKDVTEAAGRLEFVFKKSAEIKPLYKKLMDAVKQKHIKKGQIENMVQSALVKELLSNSEAEKILEVELMKDDVIQVDDFTDKHYMSNALESQNFSKKLFDKLQHIATKKEITP